MGAEEAAYGDKPMFNYRKMVDIDAAAMKIAGLDVAEEMCVYILPARQLQQIPGMKAIRNVQSGCVTCVVSERYTILQHTTAFTAVLQAVRDLGMAESARFEVENDHNLVRVMVVFKSHQFVIDGGETVWLGVRFTNSYNKTNSFHGELFIWRPATASAVIWARLGVPRMAKHHTQNSVMAVEEDVIEFIRNAIAGTEAIVGTVDNAAGDAVVFETDAQKAAFLRPIMVGQKHIEAVIDLIPDATSRWEIYSIVADYTSRAKDLTPLMRDNINDLAERRLLEPRVVVVPSIAAAEQDAKRFAPKVTAES